ncbi:hypothetical protein ACZ11_04355 [Lysinibacillus xylanilyticus]|uniref:Uncharacterized protein n=1 Tax=Lysinibacillus xylanilyticus TaxID=582475 RepID=A0A0K9FAK5_9BACI|nr:hypothetical protein ACZ11_04355 [Lysinibacillus xylanilyticus]
MKAQFIQSEIEAIHYWDARVLQMDTNFFGDEITIVFEDTDYNVKLLFTGCSKFSFITSVVDRLKPLKELTKSQIPYFIQDIKISEVEFEDKENLLKCNILMPPLNVGVVCTDILIVKV